MTYLDRGDKVDTAALLIESIDREETTLADDKSIGGSPEADVSHTWSALLLPVVIPNISVLINDGPRCVDGPLHKCPSRLHWVSRCGPTVHAFSQTCTNRVVCRGSGLFYSPTKGWTSGRLVEDCASVEGFDGGLKIEIMSGVER